MRFSSSYFIIFVGILNIEILIALFIKDDFIRPYLGDTLVVILIYCFVRSFLNSPIYPTIIAVLLFAYGIEAMQYFDLVGMLGLDGYELARIVIGTSFAWWDIIAYTAGAMIIVAMECYGVRYKWCAERQ